MKGRKLTLENGSIRYLLLPVLQNKVMTEKDLRKQSHFHSGNKNLNDYFKTLIRHGFPIRRRRIEGETLRGSRRRGPQVKNRTIIYYME